MEDEIMINLIPDVGSLTNVRAILKEVRRHP